MEIIFFFLGFFGAMSLFLLIALLRRPRREVKKTDELTEFLNY